MTLAVICRMMAWISVVISLSDFSGACLHDMLRVSCQKRSFGMSSSQLKLMHIGNMLSSVTAFKPPLTVCVEPTKLKAFNMGGWGVFRQPHAAN